MASAAYQRQYRKDRYLVGYRRMDATGTRRRLQALSRMGWLMSEVASATGLDVDSLRQISRGDIGDRVNRTTYVAIKRFYDKNHMTRPAGPYADMQRTVASRKAWPPPLAWDDIDDITEQPVGVRVSN